MSTLPPIGTPVTRPLRLEHVRDLEELEGALLSEHREGVATYIEKWCTCDETTQRTLIVRSDQRSIAEYLGRRISMWELIVERSQNIGFLHDYTLDGFQRATIVEVSSLPKNYLPSVKGYHDPTLRPRWARMPQEFLVDQQWNAHVLSEIEKTYLDVHAFTFAVKHNQRLIHRAMEMNYNSGWTYYQAFKTLRRSVPREDRAHTVGVQAASPGILSMDAPRHVAAEIMRALLRVQDQQTRKAKDAVHKWSRLKTESADNVPQSAESDIQSLCKALGIEAAALLPRSPIINAAPGGMTDQDESTEREDSTPESDALLHRKKTLLQAGKLLVGYCKRLRDLLEPADGVTFILDSSLTEDEDDEFEDDEFEDDEFEDDEFEDDEDDDL